MYLLLGFHNVWLWVFDLYHLFSKDLNFFIGKSDMQRGGETEGSIFLLLIRSQNGQNAQGCVSLKPGARSFLPVSTLIQGLTPWAILNSSPATDREKDGSRAAGMRTGAQMQARHVQGKDLRH